MATTTQDPLLDELNGALAKTQEPAPVAGDPLPLQPPTLAQQLETAPAASIKPTSKSAQLDKTHSVKAGGNGYRVVVEGEYYAKSTETKGHIVKRYSLPFNLPALVNGKGESALGIIVGASRPGGGMLKAALKKLDPLAESYRTHAIVSTTPLEGSPEPTSLQYMSFDALKAYVRDQLPDFPIDPDTYWDVNHLREDVIDFKLNSTTDVTEPDGVTKTPGGFGIKKTPTERIRERFAERKEEKELADMNG